MNEHDAIELGAAAVDNDTGEFKQIEIGVIHAKFARMSDGRLIELPNTNPDNIEGLVNTAENFATIARRQNLKTGGSLAIADDAADVLGEVSALKLARAAGVLDITAYHAFRAGMAFQRMQLRRAEEHAKRGATVIGGAKKAARKLHGTHDEKLAEYRQIKDAFHTIYPAKKAKKMAAYKAVKEQLGVSVATVRRALKFNEIHAEQETNIVGTSVVLHRFNLPKTKTDA